MKETTMSNLTIDAERLWDSLMETARIGATPDGGIARLTLSEDDRRVRDWLGAQCDALGLSMTVDEAGNMFATRPGTRADLPAIAMGSHLDTQPTGGKFDGVLGVLAGLEVLRTLDAAGYQTEAPLMLVNWTNEEGSRFSPAMLGSGIWAGVYSREYGDGRADARGDTFGASLDRIGYRGEAKAGAVRFGAMFELHIEQGPILEAEGIQIGVVQGIQGMRWFELTLTGTAAHTGSTPMGMRRNALLGMARVIEGIDRIAKAHQDAVGTIGFLEISPNSHNVIPGEVRATIDLRHPSDAVLDRMQAEVEALVQDAAGAVGLESRLEQISRTAPVVFDAECIASVRAGAQAAGYSTRDIVSGAGHDAAHTAAKAPTTMIFVPCKDGLSHNPAESAEPAECAAGAQVLLEAVLDYDRRMAETRKGAAA
ncbi:Zn-dependent hydrolase [Paracoccus versutus]|nr:Zn-dependent hydrolase [Paracoccus versutus]